jgi:hypothetical protein
MSKDYEYVTLKYDPNPTSLYPHGYWAAYAEPGYDAAGPTVEVTLIRLCIEMSKELTDRA